MINTILAAVISIFVAQSAQALPITSQAIPVQKFIPTFMMESTFPVDGIVKMSNCSASLIKFKGATDDQAALVLTNGHCTGPKTPGEMFLRAGEIHHHTKRNFRMGLLGREGEQLVSILATEIIYATMTMSDFGILKLDKTYQQMRELAPGVEPLVVSNVRPSAGTQIYIPSGYWKRTYSCTIERFVHLLKEAGYVWNDSLRYSSPGCETIGGTSGSPIVSVATGEIIGINNTGNEDGRQCTLNNPCEEDEAGKITVSHGASYGQQTHILYDCLDSKGNFDLSIATCKLPKGQ